MKERAIRSIHERLKRYVRSRYEMIRPEPTLGLFNFRCFENAVEYNRRYPEMEVIEVIYVDGSDPILHYINYDPVDKKYLETTLCWRAPYLEYYHIRKIHRTTIIESVPSLNEAWIPGLNNSQISSTGTFLELRWSYE